MNGLVAPKVATPKVERIGKIKMISPVMMKESEAATLRIAVITIVVEM